MLYSRPVLKGRRETGLAGQRVREVDRIPIETTRFCADGPNVRCIVHVASQQDVRIVVGALVVFDTVVCGEEVADPDNNGHADGNMANAHARHG